MVQRSEYCHHFFSRHFGNVLLCRVNGLKQRSSGKGLVPALVALVLMTLATERGLSSTSRKPALAASRTGAADFVAPVFMDTL